MSDERDAFHQLLDQASRGVLSRRDVLRRSLAAGLGVSAIATLLAACGDDDEPEATTEGGGEATESGDGGADTSATGGESMEPTATTGESGDSGDEGEPVEGGTLRVALIGEPPTLDNHQTTATIVSLVVWHMYEPLFTWSENFEILPMLADTHEVSEDGLTHTVTLRQGVKFHNGEDLTSADVIASIERWGAISGLGEGLLEVTESMTPVDDHTIEFAMTTQYGAFQTVLARQNQGCSIFPKSIVDTYGTEQLEEFIGTGPYMFVERQADRFIRMTRYEEYAPQAGEPNGYGGGFKQYIEEIEFIPVPDEAARIAGLQAGDYDYLESISPDQSVTMEGDPNVVLTPLPASGWETLVCNTSLGIMSDVNIRRAALAAIDCEPILFAGQGEGYFRLDPGVMLAETAFNSQVAGELYNQADPEAAQQMLTEAGYDGTPVRLLTTQEYRDMFNQAVVAQQQLEAAGFTIEPIVVDWATVVENRSDENLWDLFTTGITFRPDPVMLPFMQGCGWPGWWCSDEKVELTAQLQSEPEFEARFEIWEQLQELFYDEVPLIKIGDTLGVNASSARLKGDRSMTQIAPAFWNNWIEE